MAQYLANRIINGALDYKTVVTKRPDLKEQIDSVLTTQGREDLITT